MSRLRAGMRLANLLLFGVAMCAAGNAAAADGRRVIGWIERVRLSPGNLDIVAKLDTGARTASLNAAGMSRFRRGGEDWVAFNVTNRRGRTARFELPIMRSARIRRHRGRVQKRPVVRMGICVGNVYKLTEVNLIDREGFNYQMLIGRRFLASSFVVDSAATFTTKPNCEKAAAKE